MPVVVDSILVAQQKERSEIIYFLPLDFALSADRSEHHAAAMIASRGKRPSPGEPVPAGDFLGLAGRVVRRGVHRRPIVAPYVTLRLVVEQRELPRMYPDDAGHPAG
jgi:hypothetical protein